MHHFPLSSPPNLLLPFDEEVPYGLVTRNEALIEDMQLLVDPPVSFGVVILPIQLKRTGAPLVEAVIELGPAFAGAAQIHRQEGSIRLMCLGSFLLLIVI